MKNEEFIAQNLCNDCNDKATCSVSCYWFDHMKRLAEWKDEQFAEQKQSLIDKACEWVKNHAGDYSYYGDDDMEDMAIDLRKTMEVRK